MYRCVHCAHALGPAGLLTYFGGKSSNYALKQCSACHQLADPYIELDFPIKLIDLLLLKKRIYRHFLFNHTAVPSDRERRLPLVLRLGLATVLLDACAPLPARVSYKKRDAKVDYAQTHVGLKRCWMHRTRTTFWLPSPRRSCSKQSVCPSSLSNLCWTHTVLTILDTFLLHAIVATLSFGYASLRRSHRPE